MKFLKKLFTFRPNRPKYKSVTTLFTELPYHVQMTSRLYPVIETLIGNKADGEIRKFEIPGNELRVGQALLLRNDREVWIHLGHDYFKNIVKS